MPSIQEWFNVYSGIRDAVNGLKADLAATSSALESIKNSITSGQGTHLDRLADSLEDIRTTVTNLETDLKGITTALGPELPLEVRTVIDQLAHLNETHSIVRNYFVPAKVGGEAGNLSDRLAALIEAVAAPAVNQAQLSEAIVRLVDELTKPGSDSYIEAIRKYYSGVGGRLQKENDQIEAQTQADRERAVGYLVEKAESLITTGIEKGIKFARPILNILEAPFSAIVSATIKEFTAAFTANKPANPQKARELVTVAITKAYEMGEAAHILSAAAELFQPLKQMGFPQLAAALGDLSGFKEISSSLSRALVMGSITRPLRWWGNDVFSPEILQVRDLIELVQKREIELTTFARVLYQHGFTHEDTDLLVKAVWREPSIRDLAIAIEDTTVEDDWLLQRVRRAGYEDSDAEQLQRSLTQRSLKAARGRVISAALAAVTDGLLDTESYRAILESLQLRSDEIDLQIRTAEISARRDYVNAAIATYRRQYVNDGISRSDFTLALTALGVNPDRVDLIALDADAQRAPRIAREETAKEKEAIREIQTELVPRYRRLFELGVIDEVAYENILIEAGVSPQVAAQAVLLDKQKRQIVTQFATAAALERETARLVSETETALRLQYRKGLIDEGQLKASLLDLGYSDERAEVIVKQEKARAAVAPGREITAPAEAEDRVLRDLSIQTALNDFRRGRIDAVDLFDALIAQGTPEDEALARVNLEISRLPAPAATARGTPR